MEIMLMRKNKKWGREGDEKDNEEVGRGGGKASRRSCYV
jgi:hypothetical protein